MGGILAPHQGREGQAGDKRRRQRLTSRPAEAAMDTGYFVLGGLVLAGVAIGYFTSRPKPPKDPWLAQVQTDASPPEAESNGVGAAIALFVVLVFCMLAAIWLKSETWTWVFGIVLMGYVPLATMVLAGLAIGRSMRRGKRP
jgi:protein-S-isoprenylcysteine O-methyltransferase Ste14